MVDKSSAIWLITGFFMLILGIALLTSIASQEQAVVSKSLASNESIDFKSCRNEELDINDTTCNKTLANAPTGWQLNDADDSCPLTDFTLRNCSGDTLTITTDYLVTLATGVVELKNTSGTICGAPNSTADIPGLNFTTATYAYCPSDYLTQSWSRTMMDTVVGFFALALMVIAVGIFYAIARKEQLIGI